MARLVVNLSVIIVLCFVLGACFYPFLPGQMAIHWSGGPEPDGYMGKFWGTFLLPIIFILGLGAISWPVVLFKVSGNQAFSRWHRNFATATGIFLLYTYVILLIYNIGVGVNIPKMLGPGVIVLIGFTIISLCLACMGSKSTAPVKATEKPMTANDERTYSDKLVEITEDGILFRYYYFPFGNKYVGFEEINFVEDLEPTMRNGLFRFHGTGDFRTWFPADYGRAGRDKIFLIHLKNRWRRIGFTAENSWIVKKIFEERGFIKI